MASTDNRKKTAEEEREEKEDAEEEEEDDDDEEKETGTTRWGNKINDEVNKQTRKRGRNDKQHRFQRTSPPTSKVNATQQKNN